MKSLREGLILELLEGSIIDLSGQGNDGTETDTTLVPDTLGRIGRSRNYNGSTSKVSLPHASFNIASPLTISATVKMDGLISGTNYLFSISDSTTDLQWEVGLVLGSFTGAWPDEVVGLYRRASSGGTETYRLATTLTLGCPDIFDGGKHTITITFGSVVKIYVNGVSQTISVAVGVNDGSFGILSGVDSTHIGHLLRLSATGYFDGDIPNFRVWNRELDADEVMQISQDIKGNYQGLFDGLVAGYDFRGDALDFSGNGHDGTVTGATLTTDRFGVNNNAYLFDGVTETGIALPHRDSSADRTVLAWVYRDNITFDGMIYIESGVYFYWQGSSGQVRYQINDGGFNVGVSNYALPHSTWVFLAMKHTSGIGTEFLVNGVSKATETSRTGNIIANTTDAQIGRHTTVSMTWNGVIDNVVVCNRALSNTEIKTYYDLTSKKNIHPYIRGGK